MRFEKTKQYINEEKLKEKIIEYMEQETPTSEKYLFGNVLPELSRRVAYTFSIKHTHPNFEDLVQSIVIKLHSIIISDKIDTKRNAHAIFCYLYTAIRFIIIADMNKYYKYIDHFKFFDDSENKDNDLITMEQNEWIS